MLDRLRGELIVSCQALEDEPLHGGDTMLKMALAAKEGGAGGIRANGYEDIRLIKKNIDLPLIGLIKENYKGTPVYITPTKKEVDLIAWAGADIIALDCTNQKRPCDLAELINYIKHKHKKLVLADISNFEEARLAVKLGVDAVGTTLSGYTEYTKDRPRPDLELLEEIASKLDSFIVAEGNYNRPELVKKARDLGADSVVVGSAITRPQIITNQFSEAMKIG